MGNKNSNTRSQSQGPNQQPQILVQQHQQRMNRRASEFKSRSSDLPDRPSLTVPDTSRVNRRRWSSTAVVMQRNSTTKPKRLAPRQRNLIIKSWSKTNKNKVGKDIFYAIFSEAEELKPIFGINSAYRSKKLRNDPKFISHSDLFIDTFDFVIRNLDDISMVTENAEQLGKKHANLKIKDFKTEYWHIFTECIVENITKEMDKETQIAWRQLVLTLTFYMKLGFERETLRISRDNTKKYSISPELRDFPVMLLP
ncbi:unnamed protein product [Bursaphelenchus okinawaensis]|uniref:Globin domain-containing protein n=1 Tax=Bursaphelenchus okinawaensis TaxID=465554 RepID=A0A811KV65_9BILA|nr:unnamed protein product [Bursaphelenchus okinawaensis]CAG9112790.1 unnamed protein product [Bursaphelenchus okinawaensis]